MSDLNDPSFQAAEVPVSLRRPPWDAGSVLGVMLAGVGLLQVTHASQPGFILAGGTIVLTGLGIFAAKILQDRLPHFPVLAPGVWGGQPGVGVRAWAGQWWLRQLMDLSWGVSALGFLILDCTGERFWLPWSLLLIGPTLWLLPRAWWALTRRRLPEGMGVAGGRLIHETAWGHESVALADIVEIFSTETKLELVLRHPVETSACPRPWCHRVPASETRMLVDARGFGHRGPDLANWLAATLPHRLERRLDRDGV